jgi:type III pantothenate kinase
MILDIDVGNTRLKWLLRDLAGQPIRRGFADCSQPLQLGFSEVTEAVSRVRVSSVKGNVNAALAELSLMSWGLQPEFARVVDGAAGLRCGYVNPSLLGIDRWLGVLACWTSINRRAVVVDAGSALTIDVLDGSRHQGGYILPGIRLMAKALGIGTWGVQIQDQTFSGVAAGSDTVHAVNNGSLLALVAAVEKIAAMWAPVEIVLTGGDSGLLRSHLSSGLTVVDVPDLVLDGLAVSLP